MSRIAVVQQIEGNPDELIFRIQSNARQDAVRRAAVELALITVLSRTIPDVSVKACADDPFDFMVCAPRRGALELIGMDAHYLNGMLTSHPYLAGNNRGVVRVESRTVRVTYRCAIPDQEKYRAYFRMLDKVSRVTIVRERTIELEMTRRADVSWIHSRASFEV